MKLKEAEKLHDISPHLRISRTTKEIMQDVCIALLPAVFGSIYFFGLQSIILILTAVTTCVLSEYIWQILRKEQITAWDYSAVVTGILLSFNVPVTTPLWVLMIACIFSIIVIKHFFGGIGNNFANPALMGRALIMFLWPGNIAQYVTTYHNSADAVSSATVLNLLKGGKEITFSYWQMFIGDIPGAIGETSALLLLIGFAYLCYRRVVNVLTTTAYLAAVIIMTFIFGPGGLFTGDLLTNLLSGGLILGACYMITDYPSVAPRVKVTIAIIAGIITAGIRLWGTYPEGVCFGILVANCLSGFIERVIRPHIYGVHIKKKLNMSSSDSK